MKVAILLRKIYYRLFIVLLAFKWIFRVNLGNRVWYGGRQWKVSNGVVSEKWTLRNPYNMKQSIEAPRKMCSLVRSFSNYLYSFKSGYQFYMQSWFQIWVYKGIEPWMCGCRIW